MYNTMKQVTFLAFNPFTGTVQSGHPTQNDDGFYNGFKFANGGKFGLDTVDEFTYYDSDTPINGVTVKMDGNI